MLLESFSISDIPIAATSLPDIRGGKNLSLQRKRADDHDNDDKDAKTRRKSIGARTLVN